MSKRIAFTITGIALMSLLIFSAFTYNDNKYFQIAKNLDIFATLFKEVNTYYVDEVDPELLINTGIGAMLNGLDPYSDFISEDNLDDYRLITTGQYGGIGALVGKRNGKNTILMPYEGFPAYEAGLKIGDVVTKIDGTPINDLNSTETSKLLKGKANTPVVLTVERYGVEEPLEFTLTREKITIKNVPYFGKITSDVGYIKLSDFTTEAGLEVKNALQELKENGASSIILDLRGNPGGLLDEAINVANIFIPQGMDIVSTKGKSDNWSQSYQALNEAIDTEIPLVVLTGNGSASASEIVAGVIQDYDRGVLIGRKTFGKGLVQSTRPLPYNAQLKLTTAKYYIPSGRCIQAIDYSHRNEDGSIGKIPDSLKVAFTTKNGRTVYDGGGIDPDIEIPSQEYSSLAIALVRNNLLFDYATIYAAMYPDIKNARDFALSESEYEKFINWVAEKDFDYTTRVESQLDQLIANAKAEKYYNELESEIESLRENLDENKRNDYYKFKEEILLLLEQEIASRYYFQSGIIESSFKEDPDLLQAIDLLSNPAKYQKLLNP